jgi:hypothetical protein
VSLVALPGPDLRRLFHAVVVVGASVGGATLSGGCGASTPPAPADDGGDLAPDGAAHDGAAPADAERPLDADTPDLEDDGFVLIL